GYPAVVLDPKGKVYGELYKVSETTLEGLDQLEGFSSARHNNHYERIRRKVYTNKGSCKAYVYFYRPEKVSNLNVVKYGYWLTDLLVQSYALLYLAYGSSMDDAIRKKQGLQDKFRNILGKGGLKGYWLRYSIKYPD